MFGFENPMSLALISGSIIVVVLGLITYIVARKMDWKKVTRIVATSCLAFATFLFNITISSRS